MSVNIQTYKNIISKSTDRKQNRNVNCDAEIIVKDIIHEIFDNAIKESEENQQEIIEPKNYCFPENISENGDLVDLTRNYKQEFRTILQNLKCKSHKTQSTSNSSLEEQIKKVIEEIKNLETSIRVSIHEEGRGDIMSKENLNSNPIDYKVGNIDFFNDEPQGKNLQEQFIEDINDEIVLQVIDLQPDDSEISSLVNAFPSDEDLEEVILRSTDNLSAFSQGDQQQNVSTSGDTLPSIQHAGESIMENPVPDPEPNEKLVHPNENSIRKKKSLGRRLWNFLRKTPKPHTSQAVEKTKNEG